MATGEWAPGTTTRTIVVNVTTDPNEQINHVGIGYDVVLPSGRVARSGGWTWHGEADDHDGDPDLVTQLQAIVDQIRADLDKHEGLESLADAAAGRQPRPTLGPR